MGIKEFYDNISSKRSTRETLAELIKIEFKNNEENIQLFREGYVNQNPHILELTKELVHELKVYWNLNGSDFYKLFDYNSINENELNLIEALGVPLLKEQNAEQSKIEMRVPKIIKKLIKDNYLSFEELQPTFGKTIPRDEFIVQPEHNIFQSQHHYTLNEKILARTQQKFTTKTTNDWSTALAEPIPKQGIYGINEVRRYVLQNLNNATSGIIPLTGYHAVLQIKPDEFFNEHALELLLKLNIKFPQNIITSHFTNKPEFIAGTIADDKTEFNMAVTDEYVFMSTREKTDWIFTDPMSSINVQATKVFLENYCREKNIQIYSESKTDETNKLILIKKLQSQKFAASQKSRISKLLDDEKILDIIDFANHNDYFEINIDAYSNELSGTLTYHRPGYSTETDNAIENPEVEFNLNNLNVLMNTPETYKPNINELETIEELLTQTKDWNRTTIPETLVEDYIQIYKKTFEIDEATKEQDEWMNAVRGTPSYSEEEMNAEPWKREIVEEDKKAMGTINVLRNQVKDEANNIAKYFAKEQPENPQLDKNKEYKLGDTIIGIQLVRDSYNTLLAQHKINPQPYITEIILEIEQARANHHNEQIKKEREPLYPLGRNYLK